MTEYAEPLFRDATAETTRYYSETGLYPINHAVVVRRSLAERRRRRTPFRVRPVTFGGHGLRPELEGASWEQILRLAYEGRGA